jgi:hypothetical protein
MKKLNASMTREVSVAISVEDMNSSQVDRSSLPESYNNNIVLVRDYNQTVGTHSGENILGTSIQ